jgi:protein-arginine deiminase
VQIGELINAAIMAVADVVRTPPQPRFRLHLDADRDGAVDADSTGLAIWRSGRGRRGAVFLCNVDDDSARHDPDNTDNVVNGGNDRNELAPVVIRKVGSAAPPGSWTGFLEVSAANANRVRIFESRTAGAAEIIGPSAGNRYALPNLSFTEKEFGMEAVFFPGEDGGWSGEVAVTFSIEDGGSVVQLHRGVLRVAPWMMTHHLDDPLKVYVVNTGADRVDSGYRVGNSAFRTALAAAVGGVPLVAHASDDPWMQDCMEVGFTSMPNVHFPVTTRARRPRPLSTFPKTLLTADFGYKEVVPLPGPMADSTLDSNGNLEVTPPCRSAAGRRFPLGRIYFGGSSRPRDVFNADVRHFLEAQRVQAPFSVDTRWLTVGHVDEIISFVKGPGRQGFKMLIASWQRAQMILQAQRAVDPTTGMLVGRQVPLYSAAGVTYVNVEVTVGDFLATGIPTLGPRGSGLIAFNDAIQTKLDGVATQFISEIGVHPSDIIQVPIIYFPNDDNPSWADALTGGMVNMLVLGTTCVIAKPFGPQPAAGDLFEIDLRAQLAAAGATARFVDDWYPYHVMQGEIHCGTNTLRDPREKKWWEFHV